MPGARAGSSRATTRLELGPANRREGRTPIRSTQRSCSGEPLTAQSCGVGEGSPLRARLLVSSVVAASAGVVIVAAVVELLCFTGATLWRGLLSAWAMTA